MKRYTEDDYLMLSGIQHYIFCKRQWALIHIEQQWAENYRTIDGVIMHRNAHDHNFREKRGDIVITRGMAISSAELGIAGECDVVEFHRDSECGVEIPKMEGMYRVIPVEYKRGEPKEDDCDVLQLTAQALCLEEMLCCSIPEGFLYYGTNRRRIRIKFTEQLRETVRETFEEMHHLLEKGHTPEVRRTKACNACSLKDICLPFMENKLSVSAYICKQLEEMDD